MIIRVSVRVKESYFWFCIVPQGYIVAIVNDCVCVCFLGGGEEENSS